MTRISYEVIEDNGGGLSLFVSRGDQVVYSHTGYEYNPGQLTEDLAALAAGSDVEEWDGCGEDPQAERADFDRLEYGSSIVADGTGTYPDKMGSSANLEFGELT